MPGSFQAQGDTAVFISDETLSDVIRPQAGENLVWEITILGSGPSVVRSSAGEALDGDSDGNPGGQYFEEFETIG